MPLSRRSNSSFRVALSNAAICMVVLCNFLATLPAVASAFPYKECHLESGQAKPVTAILKLNIAAPALQALQWIVFNPAPPELPQQHLTDVKIHIDDSSDAGQYVKELSPEHRYLLRSLVSAKNEKLFKKLGTRTTYQLTCTARELKPGPAKAAVAPLSAAERKLYTGANETENFGSAEFKAWLQNNGLIRRDSERDIEFAWRVFARIRKQYSYAYDANQDRHISVLCGQDATDCGGLSWLLVGALRANGIPARSLVGRWLKKDAEPDSAANGSGQCHVKSEFYANGVGWVPVEMSGAVSSKSVDPMNFFGKVDSNFVVFHIDTDLMLDTVWFGISTLRNLQCPAFWVTGKGTVDGYTAQTIWQTK